MPSNNLRLVPPPSTLPPGSTVWAYLRDSGGPTQDRSVQQQREIVIEYCAQHGLILTQPPFEDVHRTGTTVKNRNDFDYMMSLSSTKELRPNGLLIWNFARFSRGGEYQSQFYKGTLRTRGIVIHSLTDPIPEGPFAPVIESLIEASNKQKSEEAAAGAWRGLRFNVKQGAVSGTLPMGMKKTPIIVVNEKNEERNANRWDPDPAYKLRINKAYQMKAAQYSTPQIHQATKLYNSINSYVTFFNNPIYIGTLHFGDMIIEKYCAPTIPRKLWDKVQQIMQANAERKSVHSKKNHPRRKGGIYMLSGILKCARCEGMMNGMNSPQPRGADYLRYNCATAKNKKTCAAKPIPAKLIETLVLDQINKFFDDPQNLINTLAAFKEDHSNVQAKVDEELASIHPQLATVRKKIANLTNAIAEKSHSQALLKKLTVFEEEETELLSRIAQLKAQNTGTVVVPTLEQARVASKRVQEDLKSKDPAFIRQILHTMISEIYVDRNGKHLVYQIVFYHIPQVKKKH